MKVSVIVPCHNEAQIIENTYKKIKVVLDKLPHNYEIIFEEDGSSDGTGRIINRLSREDPKVIALSFPNLRKGKGWGFRKLVETASGDAVISMDADLSVTPEIIPCFLKEMENAEIIITDRYSHPETRIPLRRRMPSRAYNLMLRLLFGINAKDTQSGFKAYKREVFDNIRLESDGFEYEIEILAKAKKNQLKVKEIPVKYVYRKDARFSVKSHGPRMLVKTIRLWRGMKA
jgi:glycosyltransferase involved in cell wall biosynthesis